MKAGKLLVFACLTLAGASIEAADETLTDTPAPNPHTSAVILQQPKTLAELLAVPLGQLEEVDLARMNLLCAEGLRGSENLDVEDCLRTLAAWTRHVERETKRNFHHFLERPKEFNESIPYYQMGMMGTVLAEDLRIQYSPERERELLEKPINSQLVEDKKAFFSSSADVFIHGLLRGKHYGTCASMPFLYASIGRRLGYSVTIAARKYHLYVRYGTDSGEHLNMEATEDRGFATPTDDEYRNGQYAMTQEEIDGAGWLRPLSNKEILGICLLNRANCLRSMQNHDEEIQTLANAARYVPDTALMRRVIQKNQTLARNLQTADRWDELWNEVETLHLPTAGPRFEHFWNGRLSVQLFMNQSTNLAEIEKSVAKLKDDLRQYRNQISEDPAKVAASFGSPKPPANQRKFLALLQDISFGRRICIPQEKMPPEYWNGIPPELQKRLQKLTTEEEIVEEMQVFAAEESGLRNQEVMLSADRPPIPISPQPFEQNPQLNIRPEELPMPWRGRPIPPELQERLASLKTISEPSVLQMRTRDEINRFFIDQDQRRFALEAIQKRRAPLAQQPVPGTPVQIEIMPSLTPGAIAPNLPVAPHLETGNMLQQGRTSKDHEE